MAASLPSASGDRLPELPGVPQPDPQWVIMGIRTDYGVAVLASSTLTRAQMRRRFNDVVRGRLRLREEHTAVLIECDGFQYIMGETYRSALASLAEVWSPPEIG